ncbi:Hypothetical protein NTJ_04791 [Nesidiocoris tenuis]|uniref:Uncharacterized protein n=1 Tax=Nesidiocoris tenuis TaxID=355587 RepID=A0ABN7AIU1_9HEMI|nr:Hypothetical protein NTJ_04791 [Nesidiocoris tenuis]
MAPVPNRRRQAWRGFVIYMTALLQDPLTGSPPAQVRTSEYRPVKGDKEPTAWLFTGSCSACQLTELWSRLHYDSGSIMVQAPLWPRFHYGPDSIMVKAPLCSRLHYGSLNYGPGSIMVQAPLCPRLHYGPGSIMIQAPLWSRLHYGPGSIMVH